MRNKSRNIDSATSSTVAECRFDSPQGSDIFPLSLSFFGLKVQDMNLYLVPRLILVEICAYVLPPIRRRGVVLIEHKYAYKFASYLMAINADSDRY
jgi:hypothetical protein